MAEPGQSLYLAYGKRVADFVLSVIALVILAPLMAAIGLAIVLEDRGPVFFRQVRCGQHGRPFRIFKFRSMRVSPGTGPLITTRGDDRITRVGKVLRKWKLDELPQFLNIIAGDMSLVGPRPEVARFMGAYDESDRRVILSVRPGVTDYASILFRDENELLENAQDVDAVYVETIMPVKARYYRAYVETASLLTDARIIAATLMVIVRPKTPGWLVSAVQGKERG